MALCRVPAEEHAESDRMKRDVDIGLIRVNYRWGGPVIAKY
jgi:outer membrane immunogenic protein